MNCENLVSIGAPEGIAHVLKVHIASCPKLKEVQQPLWRGYSGGGYGVINYYRIRVNGLSAVAPITYMYEVVCPESSRAGRRLVGEGLRWSTVDVWWPSSRANQWSSICHAPY